ncbi:MAG: A/G-specific adenine glycosylase [Campylobacterota bacterium]|nr:A/G-specific adenine glycosylase [Campylobacterota bacterium]
MFTKAHIFLYQWYKKHGRHSLPWRNTDDPYHIWISEIMLQQTQVKTVLERFYFPFLETFPALQDLADADLDDVLKKWEGLGYYTRARNLHKAARRAAPLLPQTVQELEALPGIGRSTAHAIAVFAYHTPVPIMDANVKRILYRIFGIRKTTDKALWEYAYELFDREHPYDYNQAMMDLGAMICSARSPQCTLCPFESICLGKNDPLAYPEKKQRKAVPIRQKKIIIHHQNGRYAMQQRRSRFLHGLWGFSEYESNEPLNSTKKLGNITQTYSHFRLEADVYLHQGAIEKHEWFTLEEIQTLALSGADHKAIKLLENSLPL